MLLYVKPPERMLLCGGLQSSGSTLLSWCFLQRRDVDGVLDARFDVLPGVPSVRDVTPWVKVTVACFALSEVVGHFEDEGWGVSPVLLVRDVRAVFNSLITKEYGRNSTTADDPPIRLRLRRFKADWERARAEGWAVVKYEDLTCEPEATLRGLCSKLGLAWDEGMMSWPKSAGEITDARHGNETFVSSRTAGEGGGLLGSLRPAGRVSVDRVPAEDLAWMEEEFAEFNRVCGYPERVHPTGELTEGRAVPRYEVSRRYWRQNHGVKGGVKRRLREVVRKLTGSVLGGR